MCWIISIRETNKKRRVVESSMEIKPFPFSIPFPIKIFNNKKINFKDIKQRRKLFKRNMYFQINGLENKLLQMRWKIFFRLAKVVKREIYKINKKIEIKSISVFGSALHSKSNGDYDFLVIVKGKAFSHLEKKIKLNGKRYLVSISIKGEETLSKGFIDPFNKFDKELQTKIINRTSISLPWRHLPIAGINFKENKEIFLKNGYAQIYDLLINAYNRYYLKDLKNDLSQRIRARKIFSRTYEASRYAEILFNSEKLNEIKKRLVILKEKKKVNLESSKKIFEEFVFYYNALNQYLLIPSTSSLG